MKNANWKKIGLIAAAVVALLLIVVVLVWLPELLMTLLISLAVLALAWIGIEVWQRWSKKRKQKAFDDGVSAKEGIEDRRREWGGWVTELERQGIDRYELPFYLLVGEPQAGKSVLLQNSDLHFPFGQERLSGVGGTRGCDWWFTDQAVILDLAGRLFTHEGGVADKLEWEAFLEMLAEFRPLCPANGVLLVVPCDALLSDTPDQCAEKANKIQSAILTLTQKLEANLPVYLLLTKADKIFGFAESVHRLDARMRHEMFGWSRAHERTDVPFDISEAREGLDVLVARARILRERMLATARIPEALPEVDRLYAFPDELAGIWPGLEVYLKRVFGESELVEKTSLRGIYLTSGLQTGAPIAKACADLLGETGAADGRDLDGLFEHQRAYFIKDVIRRRVFEERGLVRPTRGRISRARQRTLVGYGVSAGLALATVVYAGFELASEYEEAQVEVFEDAIAAAGSAAGDDLAPGALLGVLEQVGDAIDYERPQHLEWGQTTEDEFTTLYAQVFDHRFVPRALEEVVERLRAELDAFEAVLAGAAPDGSNYAARFERVVAALTTLIDEEGLDLSDEDFTRVLDRYLARSSKEARFPQTLELADAIERRRRIDPEPVYPQTEGLRSSLGALAARVEPLFDQTFVGGSPLQPRNAVGFLVAWKALEDASQEIKTLGPGADPDRALQLAQDYYRSYEMLESARELLPTGDDGERIVAVAQLTREIRALLNPRVALIEFLRPDQEEISWPALNRFSGFMREQMGRGRKDPRATELIGLGVASLMPFGGRVGAVMQRELGEGFEDETVILPVSNDSQLARLLDADLYRLCKAPPVPGSRLSEVEAGLREGKVVIEDQSQDFYTELFEAKCRAVAEQLKTAESWREIARDLPPEESTGMLHRGLVAALVGICDQLNGVALPDEVFDAPERLLRDHLEDVLKGWSDGGLSPTELNKDLVRSMASVLQSPALRETSRARVNASAVLWRHVVEHERLRYDTWSRVDLANHAATTEMLGEVETHLATLEDLLGIGAADDERDATILVDLDDLLAERLLELSAALKDEWTPSFTGSLRDVAKRVLDELERTELNDRIGGIADGGFPDLRDTEYARERRTFQDPFLRSQDALAELLQYRSPRSSRDVLNSDQAEMIRQLAGLCRRRPMEVGDVAAALQVLRETFPLDTQDRYEHAGEYFLHVLQRELTEASIDEFRKGYVDEFEALMREAQTDFVEPLYAESEEEIEAINARTFAQTMERLLDPGRELDTLRAKYLMTPELGFRPSDAEAIAPDSRKLWAFEEFLFAWRAFLQGGAERLGPIEKIEIEIELSVPRQEMRGTIWDLDRDESRQMFFYSEDDSVPLVRGKGLFGMRLPTWAIGETSDDELNFLWTDLRRRRANPGDLEYVLQNPMAPFLLAWRGIDEEDGRLVDLNVDGVRVRAPILFRFPGSRVFPTRPPRPF